MKNIFSRFKKKRPFVTFPADDEYKRELRKDRLKDRIIEIISLAILGGLLYCFDKNRETSLLLILTLICLIGMYNGLFRLLRVGDYELTKDDEKKTDYEKNSKVYKIFVELWFPISFIIFFFLLVFYFIPYWLY